MKPTNYPNKLDKDINTVAPKCSCLDSAFEREAIDRGLVTEPAFPENKVYLRNKKKNYESNN